MTRGAFPSAYEAFDHALKACEIATNDNTNKGLSKIEIAVIAALKVRFNPVPDVPPEEASTPIDANNQLYAEELERLYNEYGNIPCVACLYVEALMNFDPWHLWDINTGVPRAFTVTARSILESTLSRAPRHPGLHHFYIHLMEMSPTPEKALDTCQILRYLVPDAGHLVHMPSHIYVLCGE